MNSLDPKHPWSRLVAVARTVHDDRDVTAPYGFATRVVALAFAHERKVASLFERFALRAVGIACLLALVSVAVNYSALSSSATVASIDESDNSTNDDAVAVVLNLTD